MSMGSASGSEDSVSGPGGFSVKNELQELFQRVGSHGVPKYECFCIDGEQHNPQWGCTVTCPSSPLHPDSLVISTAKVHAVPCVPHTAAQSSIP